MATLHKLTDARGITRGDTQWGAGVTHSVPPRENPALCSGDVIHAYSSPELALLMNPAHVAYVAPKLWEAAGEPCVTKPDKLGCFELTTVRELPLPDWYTDDATRRRIQVRFAVLAAEAVLPIFERRFPDDDRPRKAIEVARSNTSPRAAARAAAWAAWAARAAEAAEAARAAAWAARAAAWAAWAASAAAWAAEAAARAARAAEAAEAALDLVAIARQAVQEITSEVEQEGSGV